MVEPCSSGLTDGLLLTHNLSDSDDDDDSSHKLLLDLEDNVGPFSENDDGLTDDGEHAYTHNGSWNISHNSGKHKLNVEHFLAVTNDPSFANTPATAFDMLHTHYTMDYGGRDHGKKAKFAKPALLQDHLFDHLFYIDLLIIVGLPKRPITNQIGVGGESFYITFRNWSAQYSAKHVHRLGFELEGRTFKLGYSGTREPWFIVLHPVRDVRPGGIDDEGGVEEAPSMPRRDRHGRKVPISTALAYHHAQFLATYIQTIFSQPDLTGEGIEPSWTLGGTQNQSLGADTWTTFQELFMARWDGYVDQNTVDPFWKANHPAFHAYAYGQNELIPCTNEDRKILERMSMESRLRPVNEDDMSDGESTSSDGDELGASDNGSDNDDESGGSAADSSSSSSSETARSAHGSPNRQPINSATHPEHFINQMSGIQKLRDSLAHRWCINNIDTVTLALAANITAFEDTEELRPRALLAHRGEFENLFTGRCNFYPLGFHPKYGNVSAKKPPHFLDTNVFHTLDENMMYQNNGTRVLSTGHFQGYSNIKRCIRHGPEDLLVTKGIATAAMTLPEEETRLYPKVQTKRAKFLSQLRGERTPSHPNASRPFEREISMIDLATASEQYAFRMEQVVCVQVSKLDPTHRSFSTVLRPVLQLMRFYYNSVAHYGPYLRSFEPRIFPGILKAHAKVLLCAQDGIRAHFEAGGSQRLSVALSEGVAWIDRLGHYLLTGDASVLVGSVLNELQTMDSLRRGAWPFIARHMLDLRGSGRLDAEKWPKYPNGRPRLLHTAGLRFHYGPAITASHEMKIWLHELGSSRVVGELSADAFVKELIQDVWMPETIQFILLQFRRLLSKGRTTMSQEDLQRAEQRLAAVVEWSEHEHPFSSRVYNGIFKVFTYALSFAKEDRCTNETRHDFANRLSKQCRTDKGAAKFAPKNATWLPTLSTVMTRTNSKTVNLLGWSSAISSAFAELSIECMPGEYLGRFCFQRMLELTASQRVRVPASTPLNSLKRKAMEAEHNAKRPVYTRQIICLGWGCHDMTIPSIMERGFAAMEINFGGGLSGSQNTKSEKSRRDGMLNRGHYTLVRKILINNMGDNNVQLMLILILTLASSSALPTAVTGQDSLSASSGNAMRHLWAVNLLTKMMWYLRPDDFPWNADTKEMFCVKNMVKKLESKYVPLRLLIAMGWVQKKQTVQRENPQMGEVKLQDQQVLESWRNQLLWLRNNAAKFIQVVFRSDDPIWLERCSSIVKTIDQRRK